MPLLEQIYSSLKTREAKGMLRKLTVFEPSTISPSSPLADFSSNDYLSIATSKELKEHFLRRAASGRIGGSTGSRLLDGNNGQSEAEQLEARLCGFFRASNALLCPSGWEANVSIFSTLPQKGDVVLYDSLIHASVHDGIRRSRAQCISFKHNDVRDFEQRLHDVYHSLSPESNVFLAVEALYSMDGDFAHLPKLIDIVKRYFPADTVLSSVSPDRSSPRFWVIVDEAHSSGCLGHHGAGKCQEWGLLERPNLIRVCTFGKGFGASGAVILTSSDLIRQYLINYARPLIFSTALPHSGLLLIHAALDILESEDATQRRRKLSANCAALRQNLERVLREEGCLSHVDGLLSLDVEEHASSTPASDLDNSGRSSQVDKTLELRAVCNAAVFDSHEAAIDELEPNKPERSAVTAPVSPIMPLLTPHAFTRSMAAHLQANGFLVRPITYPTVPLGRDRLRICVHTNNTPQEIQGLAGAVRSWVRAKKVSDATSFSPSSPPFRPSVDHSRGKLSQSSISPSEVSRRRQLGHFRARDSRL